MSNTKEIDYERLGIIHNKEGINLKKLEDLLFNPSPERLKVMDEANKKLGKEKL